MTKKLYAFVLMPFDKNFDDVYRLGIKEAANEVDIKAERLDEQIFDGNMLEKIYNEIDRADLIIADMSQRNPNVFYEVGYADAGKKLIILLTNNSEDIPFDLLHRPHIIYNKSISSLKDELLERLRWAKEEVLKRTIEPISTKVKILFGSIDRTQYVDSAILNFRLELHNISDKPIVNIHAIYIYSGQDWKMFYDDKLCKSTEAEISPFVRRHIIRPDFNILPARDRLPIDIEMKKVVASDWKQDTRKDKYQISGMMRIEVHTDTNVYTTDEKIDTVVEYDELPF